MAKRLLDIVITHYQEPREIVRPLLDILMAQKCIDFQKFKVWWVQDGPTMSPFPEEGYFGESPIQFEKIVIPHKGVSAARNAGMDRADAEWICFCDCDDTFTGIYSLSSVFYILEQDPPYDLLWGSFWMDFPGEKTTPIVKGEYNHVWVHNKYYRLSFLREKDIRFDEDVTFSEDSAFNNIVEVEAAGRIGQINTETPLYAWCRRLDSVSNDPKRYWRNVEAHYIRNVHLRNEFLRRGYRERAKFVLIRTFTDAYAMLNKFPETEESKGIEEDVRRYYRGNLGAYGEIGEELKKKAVEASETEVGTFGVDIPGKPSFEDWMRHLA